MDAIISGLTGSAVLIEGEYYSLLDDTSEGQPVPISTHHIRAFLQNANDAVFVENTSLDAVKAQVSLAYDKQEALDLFLIGLDQNLSDELRREAVKVLEASFNNIGIYTYLQHLFFARPLANNADLTGAISFCNQQATSLAALYQSVRDHHVWISMTWEHWNMASSVLNDAAQHEAMQTLAIESGVFYTIVNGLAIGKLSEVKPSILLQLQHLPTARQIISDWFEQLEICAAKEAIVPTRVALIKIFIDSTLTRSWENRWNAKFQTFSARGDNIVLFI